MTEEMTKAERNELANLMRRRERLAKADVDRLVAERKAEFEARLARQYDAYDKRWREGHDRVIQAMNEMNNQVIEEMVAEGQPREFCPSVHAQWTSRGENSTASRRAELRAVANSHIGALAKQAKVEIERHSLDVQTQLTAGGLRSEEAKRFLAEMPTAEALLPSLSVREIEVESKGEQKQREKRSQELYDERMSRPGGWLGPRKQAG